MEFSASFKKSLFQINSSNFNDIALELFKYQAKNNEIYKQYLNTLKVKISEIKSIEKIPFLPIEFFKSHKIITGSWKEEAIFKSSGTTGMERSFHYIRDISFYHEVAEFVFYTFWGHLEDYIFLALLPSYQENKSSSLISMIDYFILRTKNNNGSQYISSPNEVKSTVTEALNKGKKVMLWGVSYALLDLAINHPQDLSQIAIVETGGMKGRGRELTREELHNIFKINLNVASVGSEYGMTELLSQGYSMKKGLYKAPKWIKVVTRELNDPFSIENLGKMGGVNVIDLANVDSCAFIETKDIGIIYEDNSFEIRGRMDNSDLRGCNLLYAL